MKTEYVYFISDGEFVKIGVSKNYQMRLVSLQTANPRKLKLLGVLEGDSYEERNLHNQFDQFRVGGEWFELSPEIQNFIQEKTFDPKKRSRERLSQLLG